MPALRADAVVSEPAGTDNMLDSADYAADYDEGRYGSGIAIEPGAKRVLMVMTGIIFAYYLLSKMLGG